MAVRVTLKAPASEAAVANTAVSKNGNAQRAAGLLWRSPRSAPWALGTNSPKTAASSSAMNRICMDARTVRAFLFHHNPALVQQRADLSQQVQLASAEADLRVHHCQIGIGQRLLREHYVLDGRR